jgi:Animal haem peroxidase
MFKGQPPFGASETLLTNLGQAMQEQPVIGSGTPPATRDDNDGYNENPNPLLTSGFTFLGQFVDHDITFDTTPLDLQLADPNATTNFRTARYDLDAMYGRGPNDDPQLYDPNDRDKFLLDQRPYSAIQASPDDANPIPTTPDVVYDVPRDSSGKAIIADPRNDQQLIVLQIHLAIQRFHNKLVDYMRQIGVPAASVFESARRLARWHFQWIVIHQFLPAIVGQATSDSVYKEVSTGAPIINIKYYKPTNSTGRPFIPVEFSVAAYRFGHSMTRPRYTVRDFLNTSTGTVVTVGAVPLFEDTATYNNMNGSRPIPPRLKIQWSKFFNDAGKTTARPVRQFDAAIAGPLFQLPVTVQPDTQSSSLLPVRNLLRGRKMGLPSGQQVARLMGVTPLTAAQLTLSHRIHVAIPIVGGVVKVMDESDVQNPTLQQTFADPGWGGEAPLWFYILKEAEIVGRGRQMGPVGGRIIAEVLVALLQHDLNSYLYLQPGWKPAPPIAPVRGQFTMPDLLKFAGIWS